MTGVLYSLNGEFSISLGILGVSINSDNGWFSDLYLYGRFLNFMYQFENGLGVTLSPLTFFLHFEDDDDFISSEKSLLTFVNTSLFYNFADESDRRSDVFGPFVSIHAIAHGNPRFVELRCGLIFSAGGNNTNASIFNLELLVLEVGYKYNRNNRHGFYASIGINLIAAARFFGSEDDFERHQREREGF